MLHLAPLHGVTNRVLRGAFFRHFSGFDAAMAPFIASVDLSALNERHFKDLLPDPQATVPLVPQLMSNDAVGFVASAKILADLGYAEVNWNLGCPYPMVANKKRGSGLLPYPDLVERILSEACARSPIPISVKVRLGREDPTEILRLMPIFNAFPLSKIIIHPRIGIQMYEGEVDLDGFSAAAAAARHPVVYNGDIKDKATFDALRVRFPEIGEWMIGRWAISNPFLPAAIKGLPIPPDPIGSVRAFHDDLYGGYREILFGPRHVLDKMKEIWTFLSLSFADGERAMKKLGRAKTLESYEAAAAEAFADYAWRS